MYCICSWPPSPTLPPPEREKGALLRSDRALRIAAHTSSSLPLWRGRGRERGPLGRSHRHGQQCAIFRGARHDLRVAIGNKDRIVVTDAAEIGEVNTWFGGEDHPRHERAIVERGIVRIFVPREADAVARAVVDERAVARPFDDCLC